jgi:membrane-anchored glycerophosphoryl diester phosphodiesterase (GDPDase)
LLLLIYVVTFLPAVVIELSTFGAMALYTLNNPNPNPAVFMLIPLGILLFLAAFVCGILIALRLALAFPACVVESLGVIASLKRSNQLTKGAKGRTFVVLLVIYAACYAFTIVLFAVLGLLGLIFLLAGTALGIHLASPLGIAAAVCLGICTFLGFFLYMALSWASFTTALAVIYGDQRFHKDTPPQAPTPAGAPA